jgi:tetratricopeptide (TPR) repeat protein
MHLRYARLFSLVLAASFVNLSAIGDQAAPPPVRIAQAGTEFDFWNSIKDSKKAEDYQSYLDRYPDGDFAELAKLRMKKYAAAPAPKPAPAPVVDPQQADIAYWNSIKASKNAADYKAYLEKYPTGEFADLAKLRVEQLDAAAAAPAEPPQQTASAKPKTTQPATPQPASSQRVTFEAKDTTVYAKDGGQVRAEPNPKARLVIKLETNAEVHATGLSLDRRWWRVEIADGQVGYMHHSVVSDQPEPATNEPTPPLPETAEPTMPLPETTPTTAPLPPTTPPTAPLPATTPPTTSLPTTTQPTTPPLDMLQPPSIETAAGPETPAPSSKKNAAAPDAVVCPSTSQAAPDDRVSACERQVSKAGREDQAQAAALGDLAAALVQARRYDEAIREYKEMAALAPRDAAIYYDIGLLRLEQLRFPEARAAFEKASQLDPRNPDIVFQRGISYIGLGDFESARLDVKRALLGKDDAAYYEKLGEIEIARGDLDSAKIAVQRGRKVDAGRQSLIQAAVNYFVGDNDAAAAQATGALGEPTAALWSALIQQAKGDSAGAAQTLKTGRAAAGDAWPGPIFDALSGALDLPNAVAAANATDDNTLMQQLCALDFFAGEWAYLSGNKDAARAALQAALATRAYHTLEFAAARARLANMGG